MSNEATANYIVALNNAFDARETFESVEKNQASDANIFKVLKDLRKSATHNVVADVMCAANVNADFINRQERSNARFNVKSADKVVNIARCAAKAEALNVYTKHVLLTALACTKASVTMTHKDAQASLCDALKTDAAKEQYVSRYTRTVAASTADTQSSSSINALQMYDVLIETRDEQNRVAYRVNLASKTTKKLASALSVTL